ncbi:type 1 periplasmic binding fold superfamily protein [Nonlabens sp.]|uniref:type 1 periplasmic binding fold superfamily protein n=1 Tax=Nonlabens sp. TaxID=1888209 RepID=UPI003F695C47
MKTTIKTLAILATAAVFISCDDDDPVQVNEEEVITTVELELTNTADTGNVVTFLSVDNDGDGPNEPVNTVNGTFMANATYSGTVKFLNELETPAENITEEVEEEGDEHEVFYVTSITDLSVSKDDNDLNGNPLGLMTTFQTGNTGSGALTIVLRHEPMKPNNGTLANAGGETDVEVTFENVTVQ